MKKVLLVFVVLAMASGCLPVPPSPANEPPIAFIDSVSAGRISPGEVIIFTGHGVDPDGGTIASYSWRSSIDGQLSTEASFKTSSLSEGTHTIWFKVQDSAGAWSKEVPCTVVVLPTGIVTPVINLFEANPPSIAVGESSILRWNVSGASMVRIDPDIGNVALAGNRAVSPNKTTVYTLVATNEFGTATATTGVAVTTAPLKTVELYSISAEDGHVTRDGYVGPEPIVGDTASNVAMQAFLSFDISAIPKGARIKSASLDLTLAHVSGSPFTMLGKLYVYSCRYTELRSRDFVIGILPGAISWISAMPAEPISSNQLVDAVQAQVDAGSTRFQVRLQFEKDFYMYGQSDYLMLKSDKTRLVVKYQD